MKLILFDFIGLEDINITDVSQILAYPLTGDYFFWAKLLFAIFVIISLGTFFEEKKRLGKGNMLSSLAIGSIATIVLSFMGSLFNVVTGDIFTTILILGGVLIFIWYIKGR